MIDRSHALPVTRQARELGISRGSVYYLPRPTAAVDRRSSGGSTRRTWISRLRAAGCCATRLPPKPTRPVASLAGPAATLISFALPMRRGQHIAHGLLEAGEVILNRDLAPVHAEAAASQQRTHIR